MFNIFNIFRNKNQKDLRGLYPIVAQVNGFEPSMEKLSDEELKAQTSKFKKKLEEGATQEQIMAEAFATVREASKRVLRMRPLMCRSWGGLSCTRGRLRR